MIEDLSDAIVIYLKHYPGSNDEEFTVRYGSTDARQRVRALLTETMKLPIDMSGKTLVEIGADVRFAVQERHPELSDAALEKLGNYFTYLVR
ncbi:hypothetical protein [Microbacterium sp.]|uniref:hypothetical protein n=1 Tax=Microbacterium sp. TaxID=51671 RepID=UPI0039E5CA33